MTDELKECPRCGSLALISPKYKLVSCSSRVSPTPCCDSHTWYFVKEWQHRPIEDKLTATIARLTAEVEALRGVLNSVRGKILPELAEPPDRISTEFANLLVDEIETALPQPPEVTA